MEVEAGELEEILECEAKSRGGESNTGPTGSLPLPLIIRLTSQKGDELNWDAENNALSVALLATGRLDEFLTELGCDDLEGGKGGDRFRGPCPVHHGEKKNFEVRTDGHTLPIRWACYSAHCHKRPGLVNNLLGLVRGTLSGDPDKPAELAVAHRFVKEFLARGGTCAIPTASRATSCQSRRPPSWSRVQVRHQLAIPSPYFIQRGFDPRLLEMLDIGESRKLGRAVVPIYEDGMRCVGSISRSLQPTCVDCKQCHSLADGCDKGEARWRFSTGFHKSDHLYNFAAAQSSDTPFVLLVEGVPDVLRATEAGVPAVACFGTELSDTQEFLFQILSRTVIISMDNDDAGREAAKKIADQLKRSSPKLLHPPARFKDVGEMAARDFVEWLDPHPETWSWRSDGSRVRPQREKPELILHP